jgi:phosphoribosylglycinamide formyltransferase-1
MTLRIGILASHGGSAMRAIVNAVHAGALRATVSVCISNNSSSQALAFAREQGIPAFHISSKTDPENEDPRIRDVLLAHRVDLVILSGYMKKLGPATLEVYRGRILNIHPALLPKYGGQGMYGHHVHERVLAAGEKYTGATVHFVNEAYDEGEIIGQRTIPVHGTDTVDTLAERVKVCEGELIVDVIGKICDGSIKVGGIR